MRIIVAIDTSVLVSAFLNPFGFPARVVAALQAGQFEVVISLPLLEELAEVLSRPRLTKIRGITQADIQGFIEAILDVASVVQVTGELHLCRDPDDDVLLETAMVGGATHVVSRDEDLTRDRDLAKQLRERGVQLLTVSRFLAELESALEERT